MRTNKIILLAFASGTMTMARAQDMHLSQYETAPMLLNPALTGMHEQADFRMSTNLRSQWSHLSSNFVTMDFAYDLNILSRYGAGVYISNYDMAGMFNTFEVGAAGAYNVSGKNAKHSLSVGLKAGIIYKKVNNADLIFDKQYNNGFFDADLPTGESIDKRGRLLPETALGIAYRSIDPNRLLNPLGSFSVFHLTTPDESIFRAVKSDLPIRWTFMGGVVVKVNDQIRVTPLGLVMLQNRDREINVGLLGEYVIDGSAYSIMCGGSYRLQDAIIAQVGLKHKNTAFRMSYDVNISPLSQYTNNMGAVEFSFIYMGTHSGRDRRVKSSSF